MESIATTVKEKMPFLQIMVSVLAVLLWAVFMLLFVLFWAADYSWWQSFSVGFFSLVVIGCLLGVMWIYYGHKHSL